MSNFGAFLKGEREKRGWSGERLAEEVGTSQGNISMYERGDRTPRRNRVIQIARALGSNEASALLAAGYVPSARDDDAEVSPVQVLPSGRRFVALGANGQPITLSEQTKQRIDLELGFEEAGK